MLATTAVVQSQAVTRSQRSKSHPAPSPILVKSVSTSSLVTASPHVAHCLPARKSKTTKKSASTQHPKLTKSTSTSQLSSKAPSSSSSTAMVKSSAISNSAIKGWLMNLLNISSKKTPVEALGPASSPNIANSKPPMVPRPPTIVKQAPKPKPAISREVLVRASAFLKLCESHREFFKGCYEIDPYIVSMAFNYFQRAVPLIPVESFNTELLFFCLYLAWETEEDSTVGIEGIIHYIIGPFPSSRNKDKITRKYEIMEWKRKLNVFHTGKDKLWRALDFNTYVSQPQCVQTLQLFPSDHEIFKRPRRPEDLRKFF